MKSIDIQNLEMLHTLMCLGLRITRKFSLFALITTVITMNI